MNMDKIPNLKINANNFIERGIAKFLVSKNWEKGVRHIETEREKTESQKIEITNVFNACQEEYKSLGLDFPALELDRVHIFNEANFWEESRKRYDRSFDVHGFYNRDDGSIFVNQTKMEKENRLNIGWIVAHESQHLFQKLRFDKKLDVTLITSIDDLIETKLGYSVTNKKTKKMNSEGDIIETLDSHCHFNGFNEAVTEMTTRDIMQRINKDNVTDDKSFEKSGYQNYIRIVMKVLRLVSEKKNESYSTLWEKFKKAQFTGEMMHLREIDKYLGPGTLRVLASMGPKISTNYKDEEYILINQFFDSNEERERSNIARKLFKEYEYWTYKDHVHNMKEEK